MITNLVLLATSLLTNHQSVVTGHTNGAAIVTHAEVVQRVDVTAWKTRNRIISKQTNSSIVSQRRWQELIQDVTSPPPALPASKPVPTTPTAKPVAPTNLRVQDTNSPAFKRRAEREAARSSAVTRHPNTNSPAVK